MATTETALEMKNNQLFINGRWVDGETANTYDVINPATEESLATISYGTRSDARRALEAAKAAMPGWQSLTVYDRAARLKKLADLMRGRCDYLAVALTLEQGKPLAESRGEIMASAATFECLPRRQNGHTGERFPRVRRTNVYLPFVIRWVSLQRSRPGISRLYCRPESLAPHSLLAVQRYLVLPVKHH